MPREAAGQAAVPKQERGEAPRPGRAQPAPKPPHTSGGPGWQRALRRFWAHVTRSRARVALSLVLLSILAYRLLPYDPWGQFSLILASVAASAIFLPELSDDLWTVTSETARTLIPEQRRRELVRALIEAESSDHDWNELLYSEALLPMVEAGRSPWLNLRDLSYTIRVHLSQESPVGELGARAHYVDTVLQASRVLPPAPRDGLYWISIARSQSALATEFGHQWCLARELVELGDLTGEDWYHAVTEHCRVHVVVNGQNQQLNTVEFDSAMPDVVRYAFRPESASPLERIPVRITFDFPIPATVSTFPVIFSGYYCGGATVVALRVQHGQRTPVLECHPFFGRRPGQHRDGNEITEAAGPGWTEMSFTTGRDSVMWPGSGVLFAWRTG